MATLTQAPETTGKGIFEGTTSWRDRDDIADPKNGGSYDHQENRWAATEANEWLSFQRWVGEYMLRQGLQALQVRNETGGALSAGTLVYVSGWDAAESRWLISKADASTPNLAAFVVRDAISDNANGTVYKCIRIESLDTSAFSAANAAVYLSDTAGAFATAAGTYKQTIGRVEVKDASDGIIVFDLRVAQQGLTPSDTPVFASVKVGTATGFYEAADRGNVSVNGNSEAIYTLGVGGTQKGYLFTDGTDITLANDAAGALNLFTNATQRGYVGATGGLVMGSPTGADKGAGSINAASVYVNNTAVSVSGHSHAAGDITSGTFADARIAASNVTQHEGSITHDNLSGFVANEHIDWTGASSAFSTTSTVAVGVASPISTGAGRGNVTVNGSNEAIVVLGIGGALKGYVFSDGTDVTLANDAAGALNLFTNATQRGYVGATGGLVMGSPTGADKGVGSINAASVYVNNTAVSVSGHSHAAGDITSGTFADARIAASNVTQHEGSITHDNLSGFVANEHIDWTGASSAFSTTSTVAVGTATPLGTAANRGNITVNGSSSGIFAIGVGGALKGYVFSDGTDMLLSNDANGAMQINTNGVSRLKVLSTGHTEAGADNSYTWGTSGKRWSDIYAASGSVNTSDERDKGPLKKIPLAKAKSLLGALVPYYFRLKNANGTLGRDLHLGFSGQEVKAWTQEQDFDCGLVVEDQLEGESRTRIGLRYTELFAPIVLVMQDFERRLNALEIIA